MICFSTFIFHKFRTVSSPSTFLTPLFMWPGQVPLETTSVHPVANAGTSLSTAQNCSAPLPIDGIVFMWQGNTQNTHRVRHIEGHCNKIHKGKVRVGFWVGNCRSGSPGDAYTGWQSVSRIFIEEVPKAQS